VALQPGPPPHEAEEYDNIPDDNDASPELLPLSDDENVDNVITQSGAVDNGQRRQWLLRHAGSTHLTCDMIRVSSLHASIADECVSVRDDNGYYTTYIHTHEKVRVVVIKRILSGIADVLSFKVVHFGKNIQGSRYFWKLATGIQTNHSSLRVESLRMEGVCVFKSFAKPQGQAAVL
jgi:hypothetical protein